MHLLSKHPSNTVKQKKQVVVKLVEGNISFDDLAKLEKINLEICFCVCMIIGHTTNSFCSTRRNAM